MTKKVSPPSTEHYIVSARQLSGTRPFGDTDLRQGQNTALVGGVWWFGTKEGVW